MKVTARGRRFVDAAKRMERSLQEFREAVAPRNRASSVPVPAQEGLPDGDSLGQGGEEAGSPQERVLTASAWNVRVQYLAPPGNEGAAKNRPVTQQQMEDLAGEVEEALRLSGPDVTSEQVGLAVLDRLEAPLQELHRRLMAHFTPEELTDLIRMLEKAREPCEKDAI